MAKKKKAKDRAEVLAWGVSVDADEFYFLTQDEKREPLFRELMGSKEFRKGHYGVTILGGKAVMLFASPEKRNSAEEMLRKHFETAEALPGSVFIPGEYARRAKEKW